MRLRRVPSLLSALIILALASSVFAQEPIKQPLTERQRNPRAVQKAPSEPVDSSAQDPALVNSDQVMQRALVNLSTQIDSLAAEVKLLRLATERNSQTMQLLLYEERLAKVEEKLDEAIERKSELDAREQDIQRRLRNIQQEVMLRGGLRRDEMEAALRAEYQRGLEDVKNQQSLYQQRISELQTQVNRLRVQVETLRKKVERAEEKNERQN